MENYNIYKDKPLVIQFMDCWASVLKEANDKGEIELGKVIGFYSTILELGYRVGQYNQKKKGIY